MTTDTRPKHVAVRSANWSIGGVVKGVGMIHPNMATMLCFVTTDASVRQPFLQKALEAAVDDSFNMIDVDSDTSPDDIALVLANSLAGGEAIDEGHREAPAFAVALKQLCVYLAKAMIADAEGATKTIEAQVGGAASAEDARRAARAIISSLGVKTAVYGKDPNWGRVLSAIGNSGAEVQEERTKLFLATPDDGEICLFAGVPQGFDPAQAKACLESESIRFRIDLGLGEAAATAWGSDLTEDYVRLNSEYTT